MNYEGRINEDKTKEKIIYNEKLCYDTYNLDKRYYSIINEYQRERNSDFYK